MSCGSGETYMPTSLVRYFHNLPRFNTKLSSVSSDLEASWQYAEGALSLPAVLVAVGILLLLISFLYLCCCACRSAPKLQDRYTRNKNPGCNCCWLTLFALLCCGGAAMVYFGNEYMRSGVGGVSNTIQSVNTTVVDAERDVKFITGNLSDASSELERLQTVWQTANLPSDDVRSRLQQITSEAQSATTEAAGQTRGISNTLNSFFDVSTIRGYLDKYDLLRWQVTIGVMCFIVFVALLAFMGCLCKSPCALKFMVVLAIVSLIVGWMSAGAFLTITVVGSDMCFAPNTLIDQQVNKTSYAATAKYVIYCGLCPNPYQSEYDSATMHLSNVSSRLDELSMAGVEFNVPEAVDITNQLNVSLAGIDSSLITLWTQRINCTHLNAIYSGLLVSTCGKVMDGSAFTFGGGAAVGIFMFFVILAAQQHWTRVVFKNNFEEDLETTQLLPASSRRRRRSSRDSSLPPSYTSQSNQNQHVQTGKSSAGAGNRRPPKSREAWA